MSRRRALSFLELLLTIALLSLVLLALFSTTTYSNRRSFDAYYEYLALALAKEPIEIFRGFGYHWLAGYDRHPLPAYPLAWSPIADADLGLVLHPAEAAGFRRHIALTPVTDGRTRAIRVRVTVAPAAANRVMTWLSRDEVVLEALIPEKPL